MNASEDSLSLCSDTAKEVSVVVLHCALSCCKDYVAVRGLKS